FCSNDTATTEIYTLSLHDALPILTNSPDVEEQNPTLSPDKQYVAFTRKSDLYSVRIADLKEVRYTNDGTDVIYNGWASWVYFERSEEHTSELQSRENLVCRLLLEK